MKNFLRKYLLGGLILCLTLPLAAQTAASGQTTPDTIRKVVQRFRTLNTQYPQEKIYLHHDKSFYSAGDDIWFRAYLVNASTHVPNRLSRLLYVELLNQQDTILFKEKIIRQKENEFYGDIHLPDTLRPGYYRLRAYTNFMRNAGDDFFYNEQIYIGNSRAFKLITSATWKTDEKGNAVATVSFRDLNGKPLTKAEVAYTLQLKNKVNRTQKTDAEGEIHIGFKTADLQEKNSLQVTADVNGSPYKRTFTIPSLSEDIDLQFFPEGGAFLQGKNTAMAFKAVDANGLGKKVQGMIYDRNGREVIDFESNDLGMGRFSVIGEKDMSYYAEFQINDMKKRVDLPAVQASGIVLNLGQSASRVTMMVQATEDQLAGDSQWLLLIHSRGILLNALMLDKSQIGIPQPINKIQLPSGILTFTLFDRNGPVSERMIFIDNALDQLKIQITPGQKAYGPRERMMLDIKVTDANGQPVQTNLSLAVTDDAIVSPDDMQSTIFSSLLLSSDLKGYIETPHYYFNDSTGIRTDDLDCLMMTQGWSRFNTEEVARGIFPDLTYPLEVSSTISGTVRGLTGIARNASLTLLPSNDLAQMQVATSDDRGHFEFTGFEYPDSTKYVIQARSSGGANNMFVFLDGDFVPVRSFRPATPDRESTALFQNYLQRSYQQFMYDTEAQMLLLEGVEVEGHAIIPKTGDPVMDMLTSNMSWYSPGYMDAEKLSAYPGYTFWQILDLCGLAFVSEQEEKIEIRAGLQNPLIMVDGFSRDLDYIKNFVRPEEIDRLIVIRDGNEAAFWGNYAFRNGAIYITMKRGGGNQEPNSPGVFVISPRGYYKAREFYVPNYAVADTGKQSTPDLRSTIYWAPVVRTDLTGTAIVVFYTADLPTTYSIVAETVSPAGAIGRGTATVTNR